LIDSGRGTSDDDRRFADLTTIFKALSEQFGLGRDLTDSRGFLIRDPSRLICDTCGKKPPREGEWLRQFKVAGPRASARWVGDPLPVRRLHQLAQHGPTRLFGADPHCRPRGFFGASSVVAVERYVDRLANNDGDNVSIVVMARHYGLGQRLWVSNVGDDALINGTAADAVNDHVVAVGFQLSDGVLGAA
jgi:hypothetical protein